MKEGLAPINSISQECSRYALSNLLFQKCSEELSDFFFSPDSKRVLSLGPTENLLSAQVPLQLYTKTLHSCTKGTFQGSQQLWSVL